MLKLRLRRGKKQSKGLDTQQLEEIVRNQLGGYVRREDLQEILGEIEKDRRKRELWQSLSPHKRARLVRYVLAKKGMGNAKK